MLSDSGNEDTVLTGVFAVRRCKFVDSDMLQPMFSFADVHRTKLSNGVQTEHMCPRRGSDSWLHRVHHSDMAANC